MAMVPVPLGLLLLLFACTGSASRGSCGVTLVVVGGTGDLARRYIWPAAFEQFLADWRSRDCGLSSLFAATRSLVKERDIDMLWESISSNIKCPQEASINCFEAKTLFREALHFMQLDGNQTYALLAASIEQHYIRINRTEVGRIFYLAVPSTAYASISRHVDAWGRSGIGEGWVRVVMEKPFGSDLKSAKSLSVELSKFLHEEEIYLVDHYLGKVGLQQITLFRERNRESLGRIWNSGGVQNVEIAVKERIGIDGRSHFYDKYGVVRDVFQNHLTEMLVQTVVALPTLGEHSNYITHKNRVLSKVYPPKLHSTILGQYSDYHTHLSVDGVMYSSGNASLTPTFAGVAVYLRDPNWLGVPFVLISGKRLNVREAYIRIRFKNLLFHPYPQEPACAADIVFLVQSEAFEEPGILISEQFNRLHLVPPCKSWLQRRVKFEGCPYLFMHLAVSAPSNSYVSLLVSILQGKKDNFVDPKSLLLSWKIWTPLLLDIEEGSPPLHVYDTDSTGALAFQLHGTKIFPEFLPNFDDGDSGISKAGVKVRPNIHIRSFGKETSLVSGSVVEVATHLSNVISQLAVKTVKEKDSFHVAFPGGSSPVVIYQSLVLEQRQTVPWENVHIWQTDERCVKWNDSSSNFHQLSEHLLSLVAIPHTNTHRMPVSLCGGLCNTTDRGIEMYEWELWLHAPQRGLDLILLGVGSDGHVASVFPERAVVKEEGAGVRLVELSDSYPIFVKKRMTLSLDTILKSKKIILLITGGKKQAVYDTLAQCLEDKRRGEDCSFPAAELIKRASNGQLTVYCTIPGCH